MNQSPDTISREELATAVRLALLERSQVEHDLRIGALEKFRIWLLTAVAVGSMSSVATLLIMLIEGKRV